MRQIDNPSEIRSNAPDTMRNSASRMAKEVAFDRLFVDDSLNRTWALRVEWNASSLNRREFSDVIATLARVSDDFVAIRALTTQKGEKIARIEYEQTPGGGPQSQ